MQAASRSAIAALAAVIALGSWVVLSAGQAPQPQANQGPLPLEPLGVRGEAVFPAFEGWGPTKDGKQVLLLGYYNRNQDQIVDVPVGPNNMIEPGGPDLGQPTHFLSRRQYGVFAIEVPKDFGNKRFTWTLVANGQKSQVSFWTNPPYWIDFYRNTANGNETPIIRFAENGPALQGPVVGYSHTVNGTVGQPIALSVWVNDKPSDEPEGRGGPPPAPPTPATPSTPSTPSTTTADGRGGRGGADQPAAGGRGAGRGGGGGGGGGGRGNEPRGDVTILWQRYRGPADIKFSEERSLLFNKRDANLIMKATTQATFSQPGEYVVLVTANDQSGPGGGGDQCCWTSARVRVNVK